MTADRKQALRKQMRDALKTLTDEQRSAFSLAIAKRFLTLPEYVGATRLGVYLSAPREVQTRELIESAVQDGKALYVPAWFKHEKLYRFVPFRPDGELVRGPLGIPQPACGDAVSTDELDLIAVPGLCFNSSGVRLGQGGGFYDRMLANLEPAWGSAPHPYLAGLAYSIQVHAEIPSSSHDVLMHAVLTESENYVVETRVEGNIRI